MILVAYSIKNFNFYEPFPISKLNIFSGNLILNLVLSYVNRS